MKKRYKALVQDKYLIESVAEFDEVQTADMERLLREFANLALRFAKENPDKLHDMVIPEPRIEETA